MYNWHGTNYFLKIFYIIGSCKVWDPDPDLQDPDPKNNLDPDPAGSEKVGSVPSLD